MAEFSYPQTQTIQPNTGAVLDTKIACNKGYVLHRSGSSLVTLRGIVNNPCAYFARYQCRAVANIALSEGATVGPIAIALAIDGEPLQTSKAIVTPAAVGDYFNVSVLAEIAVPRGCCLTISVDNVAADNGAATVPPIDMQNLVLQVNRTA